MEKKATTEQDKPNWKPNAFAKAKIEYINWVSHRTYPYYSLILNNELIIDSETDEIISDNLSGVINDSGQV